jgi:signal peptidase II
LVGLEQALDGGDELEQAHSVEPLTTQGGPEAADRVGRLSRVPLWPTFAGLALAVLAADQLTKAWLTSFLPPGASVEIVGEWLRLVHSRNTGAIFGLFRDQVAIFAFVSVAVVGLIVWYHARSGRSPVMSVALGLLLGGALGNLTDRIRLGYVVDFVDAGIGTFRWYTFNVADAAISAALLLLVLVTLRPSLAGGDDAATRSG